MKKIQPWFVFFAVPVIIGMLVSCSNPAGDDDSNTPTPNPQGENKTYIVFNNTQGVCTVMVYDDVRRRDADIVEVVRAGVFSDLRKWTASESHTFFLSYQFAVPGAEENTVIYTPADAGKNQIAARIDADKTTTITLPKLEDTLTQTELLSAKSYLIIQNSSSYPFRLQRGNSQLTPENLGGSIVNAGEKALYTVEGGTAASAYTLLVGGDNTPFPASPDQFAAGHVYRFAYNGTAVTSQDDTPLNVAAVTPQGPGAGGGAVPGTPAGLAVADVTRTSIGLSWNAVNGASGYKIYRASSTDGAFYQIGSRTASPSPSYADIGLTSGAAYYYKVSAVNAVGEGDQSAAVEGKTKEATAAPDVPAAPAGLAVTGVTAASISLSWDAVAGVTGYYVYRASAAAGPFARIGTSAANSYTDTGLSLNTVYYYKVSAGNAAGEGAQSVVVEERTRLLAVTALDLSGVVAAPLKNVPPQTTAAALGHNQYAVSALAWQTAAGEAVSGAFAAGAVYKAILTLQVQGAYTFAALGADAFTFSGAVSVTAIIIGQTATVTVTFPPAAAEVALSAGTAEEFVSRLNWVKGNGVPDMGYAITLTADISMAPFSFNAGTSSMLRNTTVRITGDGIGRTITLNANGSLFTLEGYNAENKFTFELGENITLQGKSSNNASVVRVNQYADFIMRGGTISGNTNASSSDSNGGGVHVDSNGAFTMVGGTISGNTVSYYFAGGGVYVHSNGTFTMTGGTISGNTVSYYSTYPAGGGVYVRSNGTFTKSGNSTIYGNDAYDASLNNTARDSSNSGHAVYCYSSSRKRNATAYPADTMDSSVSGYAGGWE
jgi:hypothetical protein